MGLDISQHGGIVRKGFYGNIKQGTLTQARGSGKTSKEKNTFG
jgi:hypothetical protein